MTPAGLPAIAAELRTLADHLNEDLAGEIARLYQVEASYAAVVDDLEHARRSLTRSTVMVGELRQRAVRAERRLGDLDVDEIGKARRAALFLGTGYVQITSLGRGRWSSRSIEPERVTVRGQ